MNQVYFYIMESYLIVRTFESLNPFMNQVYFYVKPVIP